MRKRKGRRGRSVLLGIPVVVCMALLAACSSSAGSASSGSAADNTPIKIMTVGPINSQTLALPEIGTAFTTAINQINAAGGVAGREIQGTVCNDQNLATGAALCARDAVQNKDVAVVGAISPFSATILPILQQAGIPWIAGAGTSTAELQNPISYPIYAGTGNAGCTGMGSVLVKLGAKKIAVISQGVAVLQQCATISVQAIKADGATALPTVNVPLTSPDVSSQVADALQSKPDGVLLALSPTTNPPVILALKQAGYSGPITVLTGDLTPPSIKSLGANATNIYMVDTLLSFTDTSNPGIASFVAGMTKAGKASAIDDESKQVWIAVQFFKSLIATNFKSSSAITSQSLISALNHPAQDISLQGVGPEWTGVPTDPPVKQYPRLGTYDVVVSKVMDGKVSLYSNFYNPLSGS
jgi:ABC-type branched-subunit amino acid transport system substrate-binding protein